MAPFKLSVFLAVLFVVCGTYAFASTEGADKSPPCTPGNVWKPITCQKAGTVCVVTKPRDDYYTGTCQKFDAARMCEYSSVYYLLGSTFIFSEGGGCNSCTCEKGLDGSHATVVCTQGPPPVRCKNDPCENATCPAFPEASCKPNYCTGCNTDWYFERAKVNCTPKPDPSCGCPKIYDPVCSSDPIDHTVYGNSCVAKCQGAEPPFSKPEGSPPSCIRRPDPGHPCICPEVLNPVCSSDPLDKTVYGNSCLAGCRGAMPPFTKPTGDGGSCNPDFVEVE